MLLSCNKINDTFDNIIFFRHEIALVYKSRKFHVLKAFGIHVVRLTVNVTELSATIKAVTYPTETLCIHLRVTPRRISLWLHMLRKGAIMW